VRHGPGPAGLGRGSEDQQPDDQLGRAAEQHLYVREVPHRDRLRASHVNVAFAENVMRTATHEEQIRQWLSVVGCEEHLPFPQERWLRAHVLLRLPPVLQRAACRVSAALMPGRRAGVEIVGAAVARARLMCYRALLVALRRFRLNWGLFTRFPLLRRVYQGVLGATKPDGPTVLTVDRRRMYVDTRDEGVTRLLLERGVIEPSITRLVKRLVGPGMTAVDVGANLGYYTLLFAEMVGPNGQVYAFEPVPYNASLLNRSVHANGYTNVIAVAKSVSNATGATTLHLNAGNFGNHTIVSGINAPSDGEVVVDTLSLDGFFDASQRIDFMKIDVEGAEGLVAQGAGRLLAQTPARIVMEFWPFGERRLGTDPEHLLNALRGYGFDIKLIPDEGDELPQVSNAEILERFRRQDVSANLFLEK
jgi:FkbM family methyltransferase